MALRLMLFENNNCGQGNRTVAGETFISKYMVNVNAYHKEGLYFVFYDTIRERPSCASNKWRQIRVKFLSIYNETNFFVTLPACVLCCIYLENKRISVETKLRLSSVLQFQTNHPRARSATGINQIR